MYYPGGHEIYNFGTPSLVHDNLILSLTDLCSKVEMNIFVETVTKLITHSGADPEIFFPGRGWGSNLDV